MEALLPVFIAVILAEMGGRVQAVAHQRSLAQASSGPIYLALILSTALSLGFGAAGGVFVAGMIAFDARSLMFGIALIVAGLPMLIPRRPPARKPMPPGFGGSLLGFVRAQFGDASQFIVFAVAARSGEPALAVIGGIGGVVAAATPAIVLGQQWPGGIPLPAVRFVAAALLTGAGAWAVVSALKLI